MPESIQESSIAPHGALAGRRVAILGKLVGLDRSSASDAIREHGGMPIERGLKDADLIVVGGDQLSVDVSRLFQREGIDQAIEDRPVEVIAEHELYQRLGIVDYQTEIKHLYTPAMLADLLHVSIRTIRRWHRMGLIQPVKTVQRLPYFDFQEVQSAKQLAAWITSGAKPAAIQKQLSKFSKWLNDGERSIHQLNIIVEGQKLLLRSGEGLVDSSGQMLIDFESMDLQADIPENRGEDSKRYDDRESETQVLSFESHLLQLGSSDIDHKSRDQLLQQAQAFEDEGKLREAMEWYRVCLAEHGASAEINFQLAELLYREGEVEAARERYYCSIELEPGYVEAKANLGCVLMETGRHDLALAAFRGALAQHPDYADVHYHIARLLDDMNHPSESESHWQRFLELAPQSPWANEAIQRLGH
jgi:tetratricopeptide (TPR) repeat protein